MKKRNSNSVSEHDYDLILQNLRKHISLDSDEEAVVTSMLEYKRFKKRELVLKAGEVCRDSTFVIEGALKSYTIDKTKTEHVVSFAVAGWWIADMHSLLSKKPGSLIIEAIADSHVLQLKRERQEELYERIPKLERFFRILAENSLIATQQRLINNLTLTAEERYVRFTRQYPFVLACAPLRTIASYLGMTPEFLSKVRRRLAGKVTRS